MASRGPLLPRFKYPRTMIAAVLGGCLFYVLLGAAPVHALDPNKRLTQYMHTSWRIQDGSAPAGIEAITQTLDGYLWLSSESQGMYRFDGVRFLPWTLSPDGKTINAIGNVYGDHAGGLWALGEREIVHLKGGVVTSHFDLDGLQQFQQISEDPDGSLWVVRGRTAVSDAPLCRITDRAVKCFGKSDGVPISPADSLLADGKGGFWLGGQTALVHWHDGVSEMYRIDALKSNAGQNGISSLAHGPDGSLWVGIQAEGPGLGLGQLKEGAVKPFVAPNFDGSKVVVSAMIFDHDGNLWVGTVGKGIFRIHRNVVDHYQQTDGLSGDSVLTLYEDREGIVWSVTTNGIDSFRDPSVTTFSAREGLGADAATGVLASRDGTIWVANAGSLDHIEKNGTVSSIRTGSGLPGHQVTSLLEDRAGNLWVGVDDRLYLLKNGSFRRLPEPNHQALGMVVGMTEDIDGNIWAECLSNPRKLVRIGDFQVREEFPASQIPPGHSLASDPHGGIWIATKKGDIALFRNGVLETKFPLNPGGDPFNRQIMSKADGSVIAGSENGLVEWRQGKVHRMTTKNGLPCNSVISFIEDKDNRWWLHTGCGVVELPDSELQRWWANPEMVVQTRVYDVLEGARPTGGPSFNAAAYSSDGRVWFATGFVVEMVDPSRLSQNALPAQTYIESLVADRKEFKATPNLKVPPNPRDLQIDYTSPTFTIPQRVRFRYRLDPHDHDWNDAGTRRQAFYTNLPPRRYTFRVIASNSDGVWNERAAKLDFFVAPAYYQTNWFRAICATLILAMGWAGYRLRVRHLRQDFKKLQDVIETIPAIVFEVGPDGSGASANRRWLEYTGSPLRQYGKFAPEDQAWRDSTCIHPDDLDGYVKLWERAIAAGQAFELETRVRRADGKYRWFLARHVPLRDQQGKILKWFGTLTDIEDRKRAEEALRRSEAYLADAHRLTHTGAWASDNTTQPLYWSEEVFRVFGFDPQDGLPTRDAALQRIHPEDREKFGHAFDRVIHGKEDCEVELRVVLPEGTVKYIHAIGHPFLSANGEVVEVVGTIADITERKRAEEELRESETRFRTFVDHAGDALFVYDLEQRTIVDVNRSACESLGYTREELIGKTPLAFHLDSYQAEMASLAERTLAGETVFDRHWHQRKDGSSFMVEVHTSLVSYGGGRFLLMVARDITDRLRAEEQREKLRQLEADLAHINRVSMMGELTASIAHEVNQPLAGVVSNGGACVRWLAGDPPNLEEAREAARRIVRDGKRAGEVIARIRALTKKTSPPREKLDLNETLRQVLAIIGDEAKRKTVIIRTQFADDLSPVSGDQVQLQQVVLNLVMNAIEAMSNVDERPRELVIGTKNIDTDQVQVTVEDSGIGIDPLMLDKIFDSFYTTKPGGMGMGLSISRSILQVHGGRLWATAKDGCKGTIFYFTLPKHQEEANAGVAGN
jgi:PAS domain S-box-containing protein